MQSAVLQQLQDCMTLLDPWLCCAKQASQQHCVLLNLSGLSKAERHAFNHAAAWPAETLHILVTPQVLVCVAAYSYTAALS